MAGARPATNQGWRTKKNHGNGKGAKDLAPAVTTRRRPAAATRPAAGARRSRAPCGWCACRPRSPGTPSVWCNSNPTPSAGRRCTPPGCVYRRHTHTHTHTQKRSDFNITSISFTAAVPNWVVTPNDHSNGPTIETERPYITSISSTIVVP